MKNFISNVLLLALSATSLLQAQEHSDVEVAIEDGAVEVHERVAEGEFGSELNAPNTTDDPGFAPEGAEDTPATTTFAPGQQLSFQTVDLGDSGLNLWYWDGTGSPSFGPSPHSLTIDNGAQMVTLPTENGGFTIVAADDMGFFDDHLDFTLSDSNPQTGVYVYGMTLGSPNASPAVLDSEPVYFVMASQGLDEMIPGAHDTAVSYVASTLVPEPGSQFMLLLGMLALIGIRRTTTCR